MRQITKPNKDVNEIFILVLIPVGLNTFMYVVFRQLIGIKNVELSHPPQFNRPGSCK